MSHILILDDDAQVLQSIADVVCSLGHTVRTAGDGRVGLQLFEHERFDCVITDLAMPDVDGLTVLRQVKSRSPETGVLVVTGNSTVDCLAASVNMGVDAYVTKPFKIAEMDEQLSRVLGQRERRRRAAGPGALVARALDVRVPLAWALLTSLLLLLALRFAG